MKRKKTNLTNDEVKHVAKLAQLNLSVKEVVEFRRQLSDILDYINQLNKLDTKKITAASQVIGLENVTRKDKKQPSLSQDQVLKNAPAKENGFFKIKSIWEAVT